MEYTPNYNLIKVEGTDIVNPLTQMNPNWEIIDTQLKTTYNATVVSGNYNKVGTVHQLTMATAYGTFKFIATADWNTGDTMTINGAAVNVKMSDGSYPITGVFKAGAVVLCLRASNNVTLYSSLNKTIPTASEVTTDGGDSVQDYIDNTKFKNLETWTPNIGENWETFLARIRDNSTKTIPANFIRCTVDGVSGLIFRQSRRTSATSWQYETDYFTGNSLIKYAMSVGSDSAVLRKYDILNGTVQNLSSADAQTINIYGLDV